MKGNPMFVAKSSRRSLFAAAMIIASVLGATTANAVSAAVSQSSSPAAITHTSHVLADGSVTSDDTPWG
jgi:hypothetical protein